jgi:hypothetical protein
VPLTPVSLPAPLARAEQRMSFVSKLLALGAALAVARADYISVIQYSDSSCATVSSTTFQQIGCQPSGSSSQQPVCSTSTMNLYSGTACAGTPGQTFPLTTVNGGASGTCISQGGGTWIKWTCVAGAASISALPVGVPVSAYFSDSGCKTLVSASMSNVCIPNVPSNGQSGSQGCSATQVYSNVYSGSTTCSGTPTQIGAVPIPGCTAESGGGSGYTQTLCNAAPAKSGAVGVAAGLMAAIAAAAAVVALAA